MGCSVTEEGVTWKHAVWTALGVAVLSYGGLRLWVGAGHLMPQNSWFAVVVLLFLAGVVLAAAREIRRYLQGQAVIVPTPQRSRRTLVGAQATAIGGAAAAGWYAAQALVHLPNADVDSVRTQLLHAVALTLASAALSAAGLVGQAWCRIPPEDRHQRRDDDDRGEGEQAPSR